MPRLLVGVLEEDELELSSDEGAHSGIGESVELATQNLTRRRDDVGAVLPERIAQDPDGAWLPGHSMQGGEVRPHDEIAVAGVP